MKSRMTFAILMSAGILVAQHEVRAAELTPTEARQLATIKAGYSGGVTFHGIHYGPDRASYRRTIFELKTQRAAGQTLHPEIANALLREIADNLTYEVADQLVDIVDFKSDQLSLEDLTYLAFVRFRVFSSFNAKFMRNLFSRFYEDLAFDEALINAVKIHKPEPGSEYQNEGRELAVERLQTILDAKRFMNRECNDQCISGPVDVSLALNYVWLLRNLIPKVSLDILKKIDFSRFQPSVEQMEKLAFMMIRWPDPLLLELDTKAEARNYVKSLFETQISYDHSFTEVVAKNRLRHYAPYELGDIAKELNEALKDKAGCAGLL